MTIVTIPKELVGKGDLVLVPQEEYKAFSRWKKSVRVRLQDAWFWTPEWQKKEAEADAAIRAGKVSPSFSDHKTFIAALKRKRK
ncbi:MAG: hypothetical protein Q8P17_04620 [bacterium]|nr:hypothetical protein [bacterium]